MPAATDWHYPLLNLFWTMRWLFLRIVWIFLFIRIIIAMYSAAMMSVAGRRMAG